MNELELRALMPEDAGAARVLVSGQFGGTRYESRGMEQLDAALSFDDPEYMGVLAVAPSAAGVVGLVLFGTVAGAVGVVKVHAVLGGEAATREMLIDAVQRVAAHSGERMVVCEVPDDRPFAGQAESLTGRGFVEEGSVADFVRDGIALRLLVWRVGALP